MASDPEVDEPSDEPIEFDLDKWIAQKEDREHAIRVLMPESREQAELRRPYITNVTGPLPPIQLSVRAAYHIERLRARMEHRAPKKAIYEVVENLLDLAQAKNSRRADKIVEAHTGTPKAVKPRGWADVILGRK